MLTFFVCVCALLASFALFAGPTEPCLRSAAVATRPVSFEWANDSDVQLLIDVDELEQSVHRLISEAKHSIVYSFFTLDLDKPIASTTSTVATLIAAAVERGVAVTFMYNPSSDYGNEDVAQFVKRLDPRITAVRVESDGKMELPKSLFASQAFWSQHQKFLSVDKERLMVTGVDLNEDRTGWLKKNRFGYYWHEIAVGKGAVGLRAGGHLGTAGGGGGKRGNGRGTTGGKRVRGGVG